MEPEAKRKLMARFKGKDSKPEILVRRLLHRLGYRFRLHRRGLPGRPDIVLPRHRTVIFVHGCFWHHHEGCPVAKVPATRSEFWLDKFRTNKARDARNEQELRAAGWTVRTIWECEAKGQDLELRLDSIGFGRRAGNRQD